MKMYVQPLFANDDRESIDDDLETLFLKAREAWEIDQTKSVAMHFSESVDRAVAKSNLRDEVLGRARTAYCYLPMPERSSHK